MFWALRTPILHLLRVGRKDDCKAGYFGELSVFETGEAEGLRLTSSSQEPSRSWGAPASLITTPLERLRLKVWNQRPLSAHMAVKTTLNLQNSVVAKRQDWSRKLVLLGWSYRLTFPLQGILEVMLNKIINKTTIRIIIIGVVDIFSYYPNDLLFQECIIKMIAQTI